MYKAFFGLTSAPFSIAPNPEYLYMSRRHQEALAHLKYGIQEGNGFVLLTGEVGTGKTTLCRSLLTDLPKETTVALILNPQLNAEELVATICDELKIEYDKNDTLKHLIDHLNDYLLASHAQGCKNILIIDEAQNLTHRVLEQIRLLTNLETTTAKLLQIILVGQPELRESIATNELRQLAQRITARYHLSTLNVTETHAYLKHRLQVSGVQQAIFNASAARRIYQLTQGIPRLINVLADRALLGAYVNGDLTVTRKIVNQASTEVLTHSKQVYYLKIWISFALVIAIFGILFIFLMEEHHQPIIKQPAIIASPVQTKIEKLPQIEEEKRFLKPSAENLKIKWMGYRQALNSLAKEQGWQGEQFNCQQDLFFSCYQGNSSLQQIRYYNRPVLLEMKISDKKHYAVIVGLTNRQALLLIDNQVHAYPLHQIQKKWYGKFILLWKNPYRSIYQLNHENEGVLWIKKLLNESLKQENKLTLSTLFTVKLQHIVKQFQQAHGLNSDGIVGPKTMFYISLLDKQQTFLQAEN